MDPREGKEREVAQLAGPRMPADHGLSSLGLIMQLAGSLFLGAMVLFTISALFASQAGGWFFLLLVGASGAVRSAFHRAAGTALLYGSQHGRFRPTFTYVGVAVAQSVLTLLILNRDGGIPLAFNLTVALLLLCWPVTLAVLLSRPRMRDLAAGELPVAEDLGFEGAATLMVLFGLIGALIALLVAYTVFKSPAHLLGSPQGLLVVGVFGMLLVRSILHTLAGVKGTRGIDSDGATDSASRYYNFGVVSSVVAGGAAFILIIPEAMHPVSLLTVGLVVYLLLSWPLILRRFYTERNFAALLAGAEAPTYQRAPDAGMTAVGWLLLALGVLQLSTAVPAALFGTDASNVLLALGGLSGRDMADLAAGARSSWWSVGVGMAQVWAGLELVHMTDRHRLAPTIYGVIATVVTLYVVWPQLQQMQAFGMRGLNGFGSLTVYLGIAISLVLPIGTIVLANRALLPTAQARLRSSSPAGARPGAGPGPGGATRE